MLPEEIGFRVRCINCDGVFHSPIASFLVVLTKIVLNRVARTYFSKQLRSQKKKEKLIQKRLYKWIVISMAHNLSSKFKV